MIFFINFLLEFYGIEVVQCCVNCNGCIMEMLTKRNCNDILVNNFNNAAKEVKRNKNNSCENF